MRKQKQLTLEEVQKLHDVLSGRDEDASILLAHPPSLSRDAAFSIIYYLQEALHLIPDYYEKCDYCKSIYDDRISDPGYTDAADTSLWEDLDLDLDKEALAHKHFCSFECMLLFGKEKERKNSDDLQS